MLAGELMRTTFKEVTEKIPTAFAVVSCPANMMVLWTVSLGDLGVMTEAIITGLAE